MRKVYKGNPNIGLSFLYNTHLGRIILKPLVKNKFVSHLSGKFMDSSLSKIMINSFVKKNNIDLSIYEKDKFDSFNDFFTRKIKKNKRPIPKSNNYLLSPCDSKLTYLKIDKNTTFNIKNSTYTINSILNNDSLAKKYKDGVALIFRLSPDDYHRYMFICDGVITSNYEIKGMFHSVNPVAYKNYEVFKENTRECTSIKTNDMGLVTYVEVGALLVGKIKNIITTGKIKKGEEKGTPEKASRGRAEDARRHLGQTEGDAALYSGSGRYP